MSVQGRLSRAFAQLTDEQWATSIAAKAMGQINLVHAALPHIVASPRRRDGCLGTVLGYRLLAAASLGCIW
jgi:hypothetical protein